MQKHNAMLTPLICVGWLMLSFTSYAASFDCAKAASKVEKLICGDAEISKLDEELNLVYKTALQDAKQAEAIRQAQKQWIRERNGCEDAACVKRAYEERLHGLTSVSEKAIYKQKTKPRFTVTEGKGWTVCESYAKFLNNLPVEEAYPICHLKLSPDFPDLKEPDWEEMDIPSNLELVYGIEKILSPSEHDRPVDSFDHWKTVYERQLHNGEASPRLRRTRLALLDNGPVETILAYDPDRKACERKAKEKGYIFDAIHTSLFLWDEREQKIQPYISSLAFAGLPRELLLFQRKPFTFGLWLDLPKDAIAFGYFNVNHFKKVGAEPYANLFRCKISFEMPRELYERMIK